MYEYLRGLGKRKKEHGSYRPEKRQKCWNIDVMFQLYAAVQEKLNDRDEELEEMATTLLGTEKTLLGTEKALDDQLVKGQNMEEELAESRSEVADMKKQLKLAAAREGALAKELQAVRTKEPESDRKVPMSMGAQEPPQQTPWDRRYRRRINTDGGHQENNPAQESCENNPAQESCEPAIELKNLSDWVDAIGKELGETMNFNRPNKKRRYEFTTGDWGSG